MPPMERASIFGRLAEDPRLEGGKLEDPTEDPRRSFLGGSLRMVSSREERAPRPERALVGR